MAACSGSRDDVETFNQEFDGGAVGDEPQAVLVARDVLAAGGSAADAVVAMYATMSVTYPVAAGLGGGGMCLVFDSEAESYDSLSFLPRSPVAGGAYAIPGAVRGMAALHSRYGSLQWAQLWTVAERQARFDMRASRAFVSRLGTVPGGIGTDPNFLRVFAPGGRLLTEGQPVQQLELASLIGAVRAKGAGVFYQGALARRFVVAANAAGGRLTDDDMRQYAVTWKQPNFYDVPSGLTKVGGHSLMTPPTEYPGARRAAWMWELLKAQNFGGALGTEERAVQMVQASARAMLATGAPSSEQAEAVLQAAIPPGDNVQVIVQGGATHFVAADSSGQAVSCVATMNAAMGARRMAAGTGLVLAPNVDPLKADLSYAVPLMVVNKNNFQVLLAGGGSGGTPDALEAARIMADISLSDHGLLDVLAAPRVVHLGRPAAVFVEPGLANSVAARLAGFGQVVPVDSFGRLNMISCPQGLHIEPEACVIAKDPRGVGLSTADVF